MKIKKLIYLCAPLIAVASVATIVTTSCNKSDNGLSTDYANKLITQEYFSGPNDLIDASTPGVLRCSKSNAASNEISEIQYFFDNSGELVDFIDNFLFINVMDQDPENIKSIICITTSYSEEEAMKLQEFGGKMSDSSLTQKERFSASEGYYKILSLRSTVFVEGEFTIVPYSNVSENMSEKAYNFYKKIIKNADENYATLAEKLLGIWTAEQS
ncbi:MAG: hypothetical protein Ta2E_03060 [Mycoplasmoidaceae bacterium]|nr:MAG: hypothetical protein Ta2E_03060 [Mycoplasmoidaceae bacterium]